MTTYDKLPPPPSKENIAVLRIRIKLICNILAPSPQIRNRLAPQIRNILAPQIRKSLAPQIRNILVSQIRNILAPQIRKICLIYVVQCDNINRNIE